MALRSPEYLAGIIDGEGYIGIERGQPRGRNKTPRFTPVLIVTNNDRRLMDWLVGDWGGRVRAHGNGWQWVLRGGGVRDVLSGLTPWLLVKAEQARLVIALAEHYPAPHPKAGTPPDLVERREAVRQAVKSANQRLRYGSVR